MYPEWTSADGLIALYRGDCIEVMQTMPEASVDAVVCDPPYGLEFMGKEWDKLAKPKPGRLGGFANGNRPSFERVKKHLGRMYEWHEAWAREAFRVAKPGAHLLAFGGTRTHHHLMVGLESAGWEIRDCLMWLHSQGFPKSLDVAKGLDGVLGKQSHGFCTVGGKERFQPQDMTFTRDYGYRYEPKSEAAKRWNGWGTGLRPGWEPIVLARKPLVGTVVQNVTDHGVGAINIDACRIPRGDKSRSIWPARDGDVRTGLHGSPRGGRYNIEEGGWPTNVLLTCSCEGEEHEEDCPVRMLDEQSGFLPTQRCEKPSNCKDSCFGSMPQTWRGPRGYTDGGGASRFFYCAKAMSDERAGNHPTVKPVALMEYLVKLVTPPGGMVLDPFVGSGTTAVACSRLGFRCTGIDQDPTYAQAAVERVRKTREEIGTLAASEARPGQQLGLLSDVPLREPCGKEGNG